MFTVKLKMNGKESRPFGAMRLTDALQMRQWIMRHVPNAKRVRITKYDRNYYTK